MEPIEIILFFVIGVLAVYLIFQSRVINEMRGELHHLHDVMVGSKTKGEAGERLLKSMLQPIVDNGFIEANLEIPDRKTVVEFGFKIDDNLYVPIDSKWDGQPRKNIDDMKDKYIGAKNTAPYGILSVPDKNFESYEKNLTYGRDRGVFIVRDSMVFPTLGIIKMFYDKYKTSKEVEDLYKILRGWDVHNVNVKKHFEAVEQKMDNLRKVVYRKI
jgi:hypothetical protein